MIKCFLSGEGINIIVAKQTVDWGVGVIFYYLMLYFVYIVVVNADSVVG